MHSVSLIFQVESHRLEFVICQSAVQSVQKGQQMLDSAVSKICMSSQAWPFSRCMGPGSSYHVNDTICVSTV